jgi:aspartyl-tRNA(Asn)/glutamyl-tRNA(Gln) amidotransferase subunit C
MHQTSQILSAGTANTSAGRHPFPVQYGLKTQKSALVQINRQRRDNTLSPTLIALQTPLEWGVLHSVSQHPSTMSLSPRDIERIANLARLQLEPEESERMRTQINGFFEIVEQIKSVDTSGVSPLTHPVATIQEITLRLRDDIASEPNQREANQHSAPAVERGLYLVPKVIE